MVFIGWSNKSGMGGHVKSGMGDRLEWNVHAILASDKNEVTRIRQVYISLWIYLFGAGVKTTLNQLF